MRITIMAVLAAAVTALTAVLGVGFAQTQQTERVAAAASDQAEASNAIRLIESMDSRAEGALITVAAYNAGLTGQSERDQAIAAFTEAQDALSTSTSDLLGGQLGAQVAGFVALLEKGDTVEARAFLDEELGPTGDAARLRASVQGREAAIAIQVETGVAGGWGLFTSFGVGLLAPLMALGVFRSFVNRRRKQEQLEQQLQRTEELGQAKDEMIAGLSHELRTPLTSIYGFALAMEDAGFDDPEFAAEMNSYIVRDAADLSRMVDDLLVAAKAETNGLSFSPEDVGIAREVDEALVAFKSSNKTITKDVEDAIVHVDRLRSRQIIRNLISNADKHGGANITIRGRRSGGRYHLQVMDDGSGIPPNLSGRLFDRFIHDGDSPLTTGSVGVGLSVAQALATGMACEVHYGRSSNSTIFTFDLPIAASAAAAPVAKAQPIEDGPIGDGPVDTASNSDRAAGGPKRAWRPSRNPTHRQAEATKPTPALSATPSPALGADPFA